MHFQRLFHRTSVLATASLVAATATVAGSLSPAVASPTRAATPALSRASVPAATGTCGGPIPTQAPMDPQGVIAKAPAVVQAAFNGYPVPVHPSPWANFKPSSGPPWTIGWAWNELNAYGTGNHEGIQADFLAYQKLGLVKNYIPSLTDTANGATQQAQQIRTDVEKKVNIIISALTSPTALNGVIEQAAKANIPVISVSGTSTDPHSVNVQANPYLLGAQTATALVNIMGHKGNLLVVSGVPGLSIATYSLAAAMKIFANCPDIHVVGSVVGNFSQSVAKSVVLQFLATHPGTINAVWQDSSMALGTIQAFEEAGRTVPPVADTSADWGSLAYWRDHIKDGYKGTANGDPAKAMGEATFDVAMRMLEGQGVKFTDIPIVPPVITTANLDQWVPAGWNDNVSHTAEGPPQSWLPDSYLNNFFNHPQNPLDYKP
jgi:ribose transport system substrate-binding protein